MNDGAKKEAASVHLSGSRPTGPAGTSAGSISDCLRYPRVSRAFVMLVMRSYGK
ncbi:hypothetical protein BH18ACT16_BH18ACT16_09640 [soil metagenome]